MKEKPGRTREKTRVKEAKRMNTYDFRQVRTALIMTVYILIYTLIFITNVSAVGVINITQITRGTDISYGNPSWSPDGSKIAYSSGSDYNYSVWVMNEDGSNPVKLTGAYAGSETYVDRRPKWSPDGLKIVFHRRVYAGEDYKGDFVYIMNSDGSNQKKLITGGLDPVISPDGRHIAFAAAGGVEGIVSKPEQGYGIYTMNIDGTNVKMLTDDNGNEIMPSWSPDGKSIAFTMNGIIHIMNADGSGMVSTGQEGYYPRWCPSGKHISFASDRAAGASFEAGREHTYIMDIDGTNVTLLTSGDNRRDGLQDWSPDGTKIIFESISPAATPHSAHNIYMMALDLNAPAAMQKPVSLADGTGDTRMKTVPGFLFLMAIAAIFTLVLTKRVQR